MTSVSATDKVALLIGNLNYANHIGLMAPIMDVHELGNLLQQLGFRVVSLLDLTKEEMLAAIDKFIQLLDKGVYGEYNLPSIFFSSKLTKLSDSSTFDFFYPWIYAYCK